MKHLLSIAFVAFYLVFVGDPVANAQEQPRGDASFLADTGAGGEEMQVRTRSTHFYTPIATWLRDLFSGHPTAQGQFSAALLFLLVAVGLRELMRPFPNKFGGEAVIMGGIAVVFLIVGYVGGGLIGWIMHHSLWWDVLIIPLVIKAIIWLITLGHADMVIAAVKTLGWVFLLSAPLRYARIKRPAWLGSAPAPWRMHYRAIYYGLLPVMFLIYLSCQI